METLGFLFVKCIFSLFKMYNNRFIIPDVMIQTENWVMVDAITCCPLRWYDLGRCYMTADQSISQKKKDVRLRYNSGLIKPKLYGIFHRSIGIWQQWLYKFVLRRQSELETRDLGSATTYLETLVMNSDVGYPCARNSPDKHILQRSLYSQHGDYSAAIIFW